MTSATGFDPRSFRRRLVAREPLIGTFLKMPVSHAVEILGSIGFDFVMLDEEHAPWTRSTLEVGFLAARAFATAGLVRIARPDANSVLSALDDGAVGVMVPHVASAQKARDVVSWSKYRGGTRGAGLGRSADHGLRVGEAHLTYADEVSTVIAMIEDREAIDQIDEIAAVDGVHALFLGRGDLGLSLSNATGPAPTLDEAVRAVADAAQKHSKALSAVVQDIGSDEAKKLSDLGVTAMMVASDHGFLRSGALAQLTKFNSVLKGSPA